MDELLTNKRLTFEDIQKMDYKQMNRGGNKRDNFVPDDILDIDDSEDDDELSKYRSASK